MQARDALQRIHELGRSDVFISVAPGAGTGSPVVAVKDLIDVSGFPTTGGGRIWAATPSTADADVVGRARRAGAAIIGKTNLDEFGCGVTGANANFGTISHPFDSSRSAGGSSGGSAVAVALGLCDWALGTDTGGSIRIPASLCGVVGLKPTTGLVSTVGVFPMSPSLDVVGPLATTVAAVAEALETITGEGPFRPDESATLADFALAVPGDWVSGLDEATAAVWSTVSAGLPTVELPARAELREAYEALLFAETAAVHGEWLPGARASYGPGTLNLIDRGLEVPAPDYIRAIRSRERLAAAVEAALAGYDALILPTTQCVAPRIDANGDVVEKLLYFTWPFNYTMNPVLSLPGPRRSDLPVGIQVVGRRGADRLVLTIARALERAWGPDGSRAS